MLSAPKLLILGAPGSGKTTSLASLLALGVEVFVIFTESNGEEALLDECRKKGISIEKLRWMHVSQSAVGWASFRNVAQIANTNTFEMIAGMKMGIDKDKTNNVMSMLKAFEAFVDERTGQNFGDVTSWDNTRALAIDNLSGMNDLIMMNTVGLKPNPAPGEWNIAQTFEAMLIKRLAGDCKCWFILIAHLDKVPSEITGMNTITAAAIGAKLGPKLGKDFSEVILSKRVGGTFNWSTSETQTDVKNRALPISDKLDPDFRLIYAAFQARVKQAAPPPAAQPAISSPVKPNGV